MMKFHRNQLKLYAVTDRTWLKGKSLASQVEAAIRGGVTMVQLREKNMEKAEILKEAKEVQAVCKKYKVPFLINDYVELAKEIDADGVHIGQGDMAIENARAILGPDKIIGVTAKTVEQAKKAEASGADYLGSGAVFGSSTKTDALPMEHSLLQEICESVNIPIVAIGGITADNVMQLSGRKMAGVAVVSGIFANEDVEAGSRKFSELVTKMLGRTTLATALTIAGSDCSGGAGIQADLKAFMANDVYGMSVISALTAQNTLGVSAVSEVSKEFLEKQLDCIFTDIFPDAIKIGMVSNKETMEAIAEKLQYYKVKNLVIDTVMISSSGTRLMSEEALAVMKEKLFPIATLITPNIPEAEVLADCKIHSKEDMIKAAERICAVYGCNVLLKGGHQKHTADDLLFQGGKKVVWFEGKRIQNSNNHGTGCTLSATIAANLAKGEDVENAVRKAKQYLTHILGAMLDLGKGSGPMDHRYI